MKNKNIPEFLKELRGVHKTQSMFAHELGVSPSTYMKVESGTRQPSKAFIAKLIKVNPNIDLTIFFT